MNVLRQCLEDYLAVRRALGFKLEREARLLTAFIRCMEAQTSAHVAA